MKTSLSILVAVAVIAVAAPATALVPVTDVAAQASLIAQTTQMVKDSAVQAKQFAEEIAQGVTLVNTYVTAVQNTVAIPMNAIARVQGMYYQTVGIADRAAAIAGPNGSMMERLRMIQSVGSGAGRLPGGIESSVEFWNRQRKAQMEENAKLLGLEEERRGVMADILATAQGNSSAAVGQMQALQAQNQLTAATAMQIANLNETMRVAQQYQVEKDEVTAAKARMWQDYLESSKWELGRGEEF